MARTGPMMEVAASDECCPSLLAAPLDVGSADALARGFSALGDRVRLRLLSMLAAAPAGEICVCDFIGPIGKSQGTISHHLKILGDAGLVHGDRRGKWVWYSLDRSRLDELRRTPGRDSGPAAHESAAPRVRGWRHSPAASRMGSTPSPTQ